MTPEENPCNYCGLLLHWERDCRKKTKDVKNGVWAPFNKFARKPPSMKARGGKVDEIDDEKKVAAPQQQQQGRTETQQQEHAESSHPQRTAL